MDNWKKLISIILEQKKAHIFALIFLILQSICSLCLPFVLIQIVDVGIEKGDFPILFTMGIGYFCLTILQNLFKGLSDYRYAQIGSNVIISLRKKVLGHISRMSGKFYSNMKSGEIYSTVTEDIGTVQELCTNAIFSTVTDTIMAIPMIIFLFFLDYRLFIISVILQPVYAYVQNKVAYSIGEHSEDIRGSFGEYSSALQEYLYSPINLAKNKSDNYILSKIIKHSEANAEALVHMNFDFSKGRIYGSLMQNISNLLLILVGGILMINQQTTIGTVLVYLQYAGKILTPILGIGQLNMKFKKAAISLGKIFSLLGTESDVDFQTGKRTDGILKGSISFKSVNFSYSPDNIVLENMNFSVQPGKVTALVGSSGSGKTSTINLLYRMWEPQAGAITVDGVDIKEFDIRYLRENISIVSQDIVLLNDTIYNNIALGDTAITLEEVKEAAKIANIYDTIMLFEKQFDTVIGDRGVKLSGGQKQRLAIAMAVVRRKPIVVFDEATSALDNINELSIHKKLMRLFKNQSVLVIAHRLSTIQEADRIYVMDTGRVSEWGTHAELIAKKGIYYQLYWKEIKEESNSSGSMLPGGNQDV